MQRNHTIRRTRAQYTQSPAHQGPTVAPVERSHPSLASAAATAPALAPDSRGPLRALAVLALLAALALAEAANRQPTGQPTGQPAEGARHAADE